MPIPTKLGVDFTDAELDAMKAAAQVIIDTIVAKAETPYSEPTCWNWK